jgi:hypothetical protein
MSEGLGVERAAPHSVVESSGSLYLLSYGGLSLHLPSGGVN